MSLKYFHLVFITLSTLLCAGVAWWCFENKMAVGGYIFAVLGAILPFYGAWFLKKTSKLTF